jgi:ABC-type glycerol-3-phosphate transport system substrate-binding protein
VKKVGRTWLIFFILVSISGCAWIQQQLGGATSLPQPTATLIVSPTPPFEATSTRARPPVLRRLTLKFWVPEFLDPYNETIGGNALLTQLNAFSAQNELIQVEITARRDTGPGGLLNLLSAAVDVTPSILPDVVVLNKADLQTAVNAGLVQPVNEILVSWSDFYPFTSVGGDEVNDDVYGLPFLANTDHMAYRVEFADSPPISWTEVVTNEYEMLFPAGPPEGLADDALLAGYLGSGGSVMDQNGQAILDRVYLEQLYTFFFDMTDNDLLDPESALRIPDSESAWQLYQNGDGQISPVPIGLFWQTPASGSRPMWMPNAQQRPTAIIHDWYLAIVTTDSYRQEASQKFIGWLMDPRHMSELSRSALMIPTRRHAVRLWGLRPEDQRFINTLLENGMPLLPPEVDLPVRRALQAGLLAVLNQDAQTPEEAATYALTNLRR